MSDLVNGGMNGGFSGGYVLKAQTVRIECDLTDKRSGDLAYPGLWAEVRRNLVIGEKRDLQEAAQELDRRSDANRERAMTSAADIDRRRADLADDDTAGKTALAVEQTAMLRLFAAENDQILIDRFTLIAPYVHRWNLFTVDDAGEYVPIPSPKEAGIAVMDEIDIEMVIWLTQQTLTAYRLGFVPGSPTSGASQEPTPAPSETGPKGSTRTSRRSPRKSSGPVPSTFEA